MKRLKPLMAVIVAVITVSTLSSCDKLKELAKVSFTYNDEQGINIPAITTLNEEFELTKGIYPFDLKDWLDSDEEASAFGIKDIREIKISSLKIILEDADDHNNFQNIVSLRAVVKSGNTEKEIAKKTGISADTRMDELEVPITSSSSDVKDLLVNGDGEITYIIYVTARKETRAMTATIKADYKFVVGLLD